MKDDIKGLLKWVVLVAICVGVGSCCARNLFAAPMELIEPDVEDTSFIDENSYSGRKAVGMFINTYTGAKVAVCLTDIDSCMIDNLPSNDYLQFARLVLKEFRKPVYEFINNSINPQFRQLYNPTTILL